MIPASALAMLERQRKGTTATADLLSREAAADGAVEYAAAARGRDAAVLAGRCGSGAPDSGRASSPRAILHTTNTAAPASLWEHSR